MLRRSWRLVALLCLVALAAPACAQGGGDTAAAGTVAPPPRPTAPATSLPPGGRQPTGSDPLRVTFAGDSVMAELAPAMIQALEGTQQTEGRFVLAPSLARGGAGRVIWDQELHEHDPDLIVLLVGVWEAGPAGLAGAGVPPGWGARYQHQVVDPFLDVLTGQGAKVLWLGMAAVREPADTARFVQLNAAFARAAAERDDVDFLPGGQYLSGPEGGYADSVASTVTGAPVRLRRTDGLHLCPEGVIALGTPVLDHIARQWNVEAVFGWQQGSWRRPPLLHAPEECPAPV